MKNSKDEAKKRREEKYPTFIFRQMNWMFTSKKYCESVEFNAQILVTRNNTTTNTTWKKELAWM